MQKTSCFRKIILWLGCGCIYPFAFAIICVIIAWQLLADPLRLMTITPLLPELNSPTQENFWSLQEKRLDSQDDNDQLIKLSIGEFNALLSGLQLAPLSGLYINRIRFSTKSGNGIFYLFCSGFMMRNLVIRVEIKSGSDNPGNIFFNRYVSPPGSFLNNQIKNHIARIIHESRPEILKLIQKNEPRFSFDSENVQLLTAFTR